MIDLGSTEFYFPVPGLPRDEFESYSSRLFDIWDSYVATELALQDYSLSLDVEEGSIKGSGRIATGLFALYLGIGAYGSFISGLQTIRKQVTYAGGYLTDKAHEVLGSSQTEPPTVRRHGGTLGRLQRLFARVHRREITVEEAMAEAEALLGEEASESPDFLLRLQESLESAPLHPEQLPLFSEICEVESLSISPEKDRAPRPTRPVPSLPPSNQIRVEIWRESKRGRKNVRVIEL